MKTTVIIEQRGQGYISTVQGRFGGGHQVSAADVREAVDMAVKIFGLDVANVLAVIKK
jgi:hypothetical protein